jgi:5-methylcytosine-specific restriction endonuclease McrA
MHETPTLDLEALKASVDSPRDRLSILRRDNFTCAYCGFRDESADLLLVDHAIPIGRGGVHLAFNLRTSCWLCKRLKGSRTEAEFRRVTGRTERNLC